MAGENDSYIEIRRLDPIREEKLERQMPLDKDPWFGPHRTGFGWGPIRWQGWALVAAVLLVLVIGAKLLMHAH